MRTPAPTPTRRTAMVVLAAVAAGAVAFGATYARTLTTWREDVAVADLGAEVRVRLEPAPSGDASVAQAARTLPDTWWVTPVRTVPFTSAAGAGTLVAVAPEREPGQRTRLTDGPLGVSVSARSDAPLADGTVPHLRVWFTDEAGDLVVVGPAAAPVGNAEGNAWTWTVDVPGDPSASFRNGDPRGPTSWWSIAAVDLDVDTGAVPDGRAQIRLELTDVSSSEATTGPGGEAMSVWEVATFVDDDPARLTVHGEAPTVQVSAAPGPGSTLVRFTPGPLEARVPVAVDQRWADRAGLRKGDMSDLVVAGVPVEGIVTETVPEVRGGFDEAYLSANLSVVNRLLLLGQREVPAPETVWINSSEASGVASLITDPAGADVAAWRYGDYQRTVDEIGQGVVDVAIAERSSARPLLVTAATYLVGAAALLVVIWNAVAVLWLWPRRRGVVARVARGRSPLPAAYLAGIVAGLALAQLSVPTLVELSHEVATLPVEARPEPLVIVAALLLAARETRRAGTALGLDREARQTTSTGEGAVVSRPGPVACARRPL